jgi:hypothetical protein
MSEHPFDQPRLENEIDLYIAIRSPEEKSGAALIEGNILQTGNVPGLYCELIGEVA